MAERIHLEGMELLRLHYCGITSRKGFVDLGFPTTMKVLEGKGLVTPVGSGYKITTLGLETLKLYKKELEVI